MVIQSFLLPDTRNEAKSWIERNIPSGKHLLMDQVLVTMLGRVDQEAKPAPCPSYPYTIEAAIMKIDVILMVAIKGVHGASGLVGSRPQGYIMNAFAASW
jgi:hypothetical protein